MWNLIIGLVLIALFFVLVFMLKSGYDHKKKIDEEEAGKDN